MSYGPPCSSFSSQVPWVGSDVEREDSWELVDPEPADQLPVQAPVVPVSGQLLKSRGEVPDLHLSPAKELELKSANESRLREFVFAELESFYLSSELGGSRSESVYRIARAVRAGVGARDKFLGLTDYTVTSPKVGVSNKWYVCLRAPAFPTGFITQDYRKYQVLVQDRAGRFHKTGVSHAFPTLIEVAAFLAGSQSRWPLDLQ